LAINIIKIVLSLIPIIVHAIDAAEAAIPQSGFGAQKLDLVKGWLSTAYNNAMVVTASFDAVWPSLEKRSAVIVTAKKTTS